MTRPKLLFLVLFSAIVAIVASIAHAHAADFTVQHNGVTVFTAPGLVTNGGVYNFCDTPAQCGNTPPPPAPNQLTRANVAYNTNPQVDRNVDLTIWNKVWGRVAYSEAGWPWPASSGSRPHFVLGRNQFTCTKFTTTNVTGLSQLSMASYQTVGNLDVSIAPMCGDFSAWPSPINSLNIGGPSCTKSAIGAFASAFMTYRIGDSTGTADRPGFCGLAPRTDYYLNVRFHEGQPIPNTGALCNVLGCQVGIQSNPATR